MQEYNRMCLKSYCSILICSLFLFALISFNSYALENNQDLEKQIILLNETNNNTQKEENKIVYSPENKNQSNEKINLKFLEDNASVFTIIFSALVTFATIVYAILTWQLVSETRKMREIQTEPKISIIVQPREESLSLIDMIIENIGSGPAYNINFEITPDIELSAGKFLNKSGFIKNGLRYLSPRQKIQFYFTTLFENYEKKIKSFFEIKVMYQNNMGKKYEDIFIIDFSQFADLNTFGEPSLYNLSKNIEKIQNDIHNISSGLSKLKVITYTIKEAEEEKKLILKKFDETNLTLNDKE